MIGADVTQTQEKMCPKEEEGRFLVPLIQAHATHSEGDLLGGGRRGKYTSVGTHRLKLMQGPVPQKLTQGPVLLFIRFQENATRGRTP